MDFGICGKVGPTVGGGGVAAGAALSTATELRTQPTRRESTPAVAVRFSEKDSSCTATEIFELCRNVSIRCDSCGSGTSSN